MKVWLKNSDLLKTVIVPLSQWKQEISHLSIFSYVRKEHPETIYPLVGYHYELYNMIKEATLEGRKITVKEICERMPEYYYLNEKECNYSNCPNLYKDVDYLNHAKFSKIICKDNGGFFLANKEEALVYEEKLHNEALKAFAEYWTIHRKIEAAASIADMFLIPFLKSLEKREDGTYYSKELNRTYRVNDKGELEEIK